MWPTSVFRIYGAFAYNGEWPDFHIFAFLSRNSLPFLCRLRFTASSEGKEKEKRDEIGRGPTDTFADSAHLN